MTVGRTRRAVWPLAAVLAVLVAVGQLAVAAAAEHPSRRYWPLVGPAVEAVLSPRYLLLVAALVLLGSARGLLRGQRVASAVVLAVAALTMPAPPSRPERLIGYGVHVLLVVVLVVGWESFDVRSDPRHQRRGLATLVGGLAVVLVYGTLGLYLLDSQFDASTTFGESLLGSLRLLFLLPVDSVVARTPRGMWFLGSVRVMAVLVVLAAVSQLTMTVIERERQRRRDLATIEAIAQRWGTTSLAPFQLTPDKSWVLSDDRCAFLAYKLVGRVAVALGGPTGPPAARPSVVGAFVERCRRNGWIPAFHQLDADGASVVAAAGFKAVKIGEEAIIDLADFDLADPHWKSLRSALRRVQRAGLGVVELVPPLDGSTVAELREVSDAWLAVDGHRERTFTLGQFDEDYLRSCPVLAVAAPDGRIAAFTNLVPSYGSTNGNFDLVRRRPDAPNGVMDALYVGLIEHYRRAGAAGLTLGLAPLAHLEGNGVADHALRLLADHGDRAFRFDGLRRFKEKWRPRWEPRYTAYRHDAELPRVALAVTRAGELPHDGRLRASVQRLVTGHPFTIALLSVVAWFMAATAISGATFRSLLRRFGMDWRDLVHLQLWRLPTSQLLQPHPGLVWSNIVLLLVTVPLAERRIGSRAAVAVFFLSDWLSTLVVIFGVRLWALAGDVHAEVVLRTRDSGASSGTWALATAIAWTLPPGRLRRIALGGIAVILTAELVLDRMMFDLQHALAALAAIAVVEGARHWHLDAPTAASRRPLEGGAVS